MSKPSGSPSVGSPLRRRSPAWLSLSAVILAVPVVLACATPLYQRQSPTLIGMPFFYWFQLALPLLTAAATGTVYLLLFAGLNDDESEEVRG
ncbi:DUF3311 domain-containing protein [Saccharopolyspora sp. NPDC049426]|uniref:DUF3311 domain-containing protein n=1 Tax=Saccharopolyspora sp. NPDC049426 TaxID=3155652 RepID=UPI003437A460